MVLGLGGAAAFAADGSYKVSDQIDQIINELNEFVDAFLHELHLLYIIFNIIIS